MDTKERRGSAERKGRGQGDPRLVFRLASGISRIYTGQDQRYPVRLRDQILLWNQSCGIVEK